MKPLTLEALQELVATTRAVVEFPQRGLAVTVRELTAAEFLRVHEVVGDDPSREDEAKTLVCSLGICDANYDSDEGRAQLAQMPSRVREVVAAKILEMSAIDYGGIPKNLPGGADSPLDSASPSESSTPTT